MLLIANLDAFREPCLIDALKSSNLKIFNFFRYVL
jgi:hypothetical protein